MTRCTSAQTVEANATPWRPMKASEQDARVNSSGVLRSVITGWPPGMLQDDCPELSKWLANKPEAPRLVRESCDRILMEAKMKQKKSKTGGKGKGKC